MPITTAAGEAFAGLILTVLGGSVGDPLGRNKVMFAALGDHVVHAAQDAFRSGLRVSLLFAAVLLAGAGVSLVAVHRPLDSKNPAGWRYPNDRMQRGDGWTFTVGAWPGAARSLLFAGDWELLFGRVRATPG
ncbi:MAG: hypothetical protein ACXVXL_31780 [Solirubrobacteraceae bacterium]